MSVTTVSLALRNHPRISEKVRTQIKQVAEQMNYQPDPAAQALRDRSLQKNGSERFCGTLAFVMSQDYAALRRRTPCCQEWDRMLKECCRASGYQLDWFEVGPSIREQKSLDRVLKARGIRGLLFDGANEELHGWNLDWDHYAVVAYSSARHEHFIHDVISSSYHDTVEVVKQLHELGYQRPGYFIPSELYDYWSIGFVAARNKFYGGLELPVVDQALSGDVRAAFRQWVDRYKPDVVIGCEDTFLEELARMGLQVPQDIGFIWLDVLPGHENISGMIQQRDSAHKMMIDLLHGMLTRHEYGPPSNPMCVQVPSCWNQGVTVCRQF